MADTTTSPKPKATKAAPKRSAAKAAARPGGARTRAAATHARTTARTRSTAARGTTDRVGDYAERAVLIPVGAALMAREQVLSTVSNVLESYSTPARAQAQLRKFERRGSTARTRLEREVRKTRTRAERELRLRRRELERRRTHLTQSLTSQVEQTQAQLEKTQSQIEDAVRSRLEDGTDFASRLQERVLRMV